MTRNAAQPETTTWYATGETLTVNGTKITMYSTTKPAPARKVLTCKVGRGRNVHAIVSRAGRTGFPMCGQPRKGINAVHSVGYFGTADEHTVTCPKCRAALAR
jgi:hypothetical protein